VSTMTRAETDTWSVGDRLPNGNHILALEAFVWGGYYWVVLALCRGPMPYVTWQMEADGTTYWGHYHSDIGAVIDDYVERTRWMRCMADGR